MSVTFRITGISDGLKVIDRQLAAIEERARDVSPAHRAHPGNGLRSPSRPSAIERRKDSGRRIRF
jgi:hypothetical protein